MNRQIRLYALGALVAAGLVVLPPVASADVIAIANSSFESAVNLSDGAGWEAGPADSGYGVWQHPDPSANGATDGTTIMWAPGFGEGNDPHPKEDGPLYQTTGHIIAPGETFSLTFDASSYTLGMGWSATLYYLDGVTRVPLVTATFADPDGDRADVERYTVSTLGGASGIDLSYNGAVWVEGAATAWTQGSPTVVLGVPFAQAIGRPLGVEFIANTTGLGLHLDNVHLTSTPGVPEPLTMSLLGLGGLALLYRRKR